MSANLANFTKGRFVRIWASFEKKLVGPASIELPNFKWTVLEAQKELRAQISHAWTTFAKFSEIWEILRGFSLFWSFSNV